MTFQYSVCKEMFDTRGYTIICEEEHLLLGINENQVVSVIVKQKVGLQELKQCYILWEKQKADQRILIYHSLTPQAKHLIQANLPIETFQHSEMLFNITRHHWVPPHRLSNIQHLEKTKYPCILHTDPVVKFLGFKVGQVVEITRPNGELYYRRVV